MLDMIFFLGLIRQHGRKPAGWISILPGVRDLLWIDQANAYNAFAWALERGDVHYLPQYESRCSSAEDG